MNFFKKLLQALFGGSPQAEKNIRHVGSQRAQQTAGGTTATSRESAGASAENQPQPLPSAKTTAAAPARATTTTTTTAKATATAGKSAGASSLPTGPAESAPAAGGEPVDTFTQEPPAPLASQGDRVDSSFRPETPEEADVELVVEGQELRELEFQEEHESSGGQLAGLENKLVERIGRRIEAGKFVLPQLPQTSQAAMEMTSKAGADFIEIVEMIETDPVLSSELLKIANSAMYAGGERAETLLSAAVRIGLRALRSLIMSVSMRGVILRDKELSTFAEDVWHQSRSVGEIARAIAKPLGMDPDRAYLLGLLQDIGKVSVIAMLRRENKDKLELSPSLIGRIFTLYHEKAGAALAEAWNLSEELIAVAGCHHDYESNPTHPRSAAFARLAHRLDLFLSLEQDSSYRSLISFPELEFLEVNTDQGHRVFAAAREAFELLHRPPQPEEEEEGVEEAA